MTNGHHSDLPEVASGPAAAGETYQRFLTDLFGAIAYGQLSAFERMSSDARFSPTLHDRATLGRLAVHEYAHFELICERLSAMGVDPEAAMRPFQPSVDAFHDRTRPADWYESLMKFYVTDAISDDFYAAVASRLDAETNSLIQGLKATEQPGEILLSRLREALADDPRLASRLALWGRRLVGEALTQAQRVAIERAFLAGLVDGGGQEGLDAEIKRLTAQLTRNHSKRMSLLGLTA
ncbi:ferritin-like domain-containing protein [Arthrobacter sp. zg-Y20]|uniref:ferritin-like fold-containing protein n=1 Tax=unclassified Arthrobacter TaxID=235627 RepID=UPI001D154114|nr:MULTISPECIES: ferritin-like fold-containing protein [unclassified Arthrobacter]MCC3276778.1 ferritin-like domain-containing protein [Arthrobacter sp. zg-Y20]MDK1316936.1 ferritin-like fold-containing protein [Arthrobacter sp. zg.Y20]WIB05348.1 ferritin-like fold-containing protein [Arthrobacter sp. zg-Y20]